MRRSIACCIALVEPCERMDFARAHRRQVVLLPAAAAERQRVPHGAKRARHLFAYRCCTRLDLPAAVREGYELRGPCALAAAHQWLHAVCHWVVPARYCSLVSEQRYLNAKQRTSLRPDAICCAMNVDACLYSSQLFRITSSWHSMWAVFTTSRTPAASVPLHAQRVCVLHISVEKRVRTGETGCRSGGKQASRPAQSLGTGGRLRASPAGGRQAG